MVTKIPAGLHCAGLINFDMEYCFSGLCPVASRYLYLHETRVCSVLGHDNLCVRISFNGYGISTLFQDGAVV